MVIGGTMNFGRWGEEYEGWCSGAENLMPRRMWCRIALQWNWTDSFCPLIACQVVKIKVM